MKEPLGTPRRRGKGNKTDLKDKGLDGANWIHLAQQKQFAGFCEHGKKNLTNQSMQQGPS